MRLAMVISALVLVMLIPLGAKAQVASGNCNLPQAAFCDTFDSPFPQANRTGQLDPAKWDIGRWSGLTNTGSNQINMFPPADAMHCKVPVSGVMPPFDYFMCGVEAGESEHFMEALNAGGSYLYNDARVRQPFDFANRTGAITWDVDAKNSGNHGWWTEMWVTDQPVLGPHDNTYVSLPRNGFGIEFAGNCTPIPGNGSSDGAATTGPSTLYLVRNYQVFSMSYFNPSGGATYSMDQPCVQAMPDMKNHIKVLVNQNHAEVWMTDADMDTLTPPQPAAYHLMAHLDGLNLGFTRGYVHFEHATYNPEKSAPGGTSQSQTYHWDNIGFDGPILPVPPQFNVDDADTAAPGGGTNTGYGVGLTGLYQHPPLVIPGVNLAGATSAFLSFSHTSYDHAGAYQLNGGPWHAWTSPYPDNDNMLLLPVDLSELHAGDNTLNFRAATNEQQNMVDNIDMILNVDGAATPQPTSTGTATVTTTPTSSPTPTMTVTLTQTSTVTLTPSPTSTLTVTPGPSATSTSSIETCAAVVLVNGQQTTVIKPISFCQPSV